jgi:lipopolysaccharide/colanic/teichoic acid biosynthesis glycosyltransferase
MAQTTQQADHFWLYETVLSYWRTKVGMDILEIVNYKFKRFLDIVISTYGLIILSPFFLLIAVLIKFYSPGPVFYKATRVGRKGQTFKLYKFRSMVVNADKNGPAVTHAGDNRITPIGKFLRKTKLDELPQLFNVMKGDMSLVGPRPEDPHYVALYTPEQQKILYIRPGITGAASVVFRNEEQMLKGDDWEKQYVEEVLPTKLAVDLEYAKKPTVLKDLSILVKTVQVLLD